MDEGERPGLSELRERSREAVLKEWEAWERALPAEAASEWEPGALYVRESDADSLAGDAPVVQARNALANLAARQVYVGRDAVFFENVTGTNLAARPVFQQAVAEAVAGRFKVIGGYMSSRFFRNAEEAAAVKRRLRMAGARLIWPGKPELDERQPAAWLLDRQIDNGDELHSRMLSFYLGEALEFKTRKGEPLGQLHEVWRVAERGPALRAGRIPPAIRWELVQPLASIVREGARRYLAGDSYKDLAAWSEGTELEGISPRGRRMDWLWWRDLLRNPKVAGYHRPTQYMGYKPGVESPKRSKRISREELEPCLLPAIITLDEWERIRTLSESRLRIPKKRKKYRAELLCGIAVDARCGHKIHLTGGRRTDGEYWMACRDRGAVERKHATEFRASDASRELDDLLSKLSFADPVLIAAVTHELTAIAGPSGSPAPQPPPRELIQLRSALGALDADLFPDMCTQLRAQIAELERRFPVAAAPTNQRAFQASVEQLRDWARIWRTAEPNDKNDLLKAGGLQVVIEPTKHPGRKRHWECDCKRSRVVSISATVPEFALALAVGLSGYPTLDGISGQIPPNVGFRPVDLVELTPAHASILQNLAVLDTVQGVAA